MLEKGRRVGLRPHSHSNSAGRVCRRSLCMRKVVRAAITAGARSLSQAAAGQTEGKQLAAGHWQASSVLIARVAVLIVDPRFVLVPKQFKQAVERTKEAAASEVVQLGVPDSLLPALSRPRTQLADSDDPGAGCGCAARCCCSSRLLTAPALQATATASALRQSSSSCS